jgi:biopolymer transport protein ExbB
VNFLRGWLSNSELIVAGGWIIVAIIVLTFLMWLLILERYLFLWRETRHLVSSTFDRWLALRTGDARCNMRLRASVTRGFHESLARSLGTIRVITAILPLLGLLGTVAGMITTFEVMTVFGTGNVRGMAQGISQALVTTMAGLMASLSGLYFANDLEQRINSRTNHLNEHLNLEGDGAA